MTETVAADCAALQQLVVIHDAYRAMISGPDTLKSSAAKHIVQNVPMYASNYFVSAFQSLGLDTNTARLDALMLDSYLQAGQLLSGTAVHIATLKNHEHNLTWLSGEISRTGCFRETATGSGSHAGLILPKPDDQTQKSSRTMSETVGRIFDQRMITRILAALSVCAGGFAYYRSRTARIARVERLPRETIALPVQVSHADSQKTVILLDLSLGGAKIEWKDPPEPGEAVTLDMQSVTSQSSIVWSNAFFAGVMFDEHLTVDEFNTLIEANGSQTRSQLTGVYR